MLRYGSTVFHKIFDCLLVKRDLIMTGEMFEMGFYYRYGFALDYGNRTFRAGADTGTKAVAEQVAHKPGFPINDLERPLGTVRDALAAARALRFIDADYLSFHGRVSVFWYHPIRLSILRMGNISSGAGSEYGDFSDRRREFPLAPPI
jgi:hypothetical protein